MTPNRFASLLSAAALSGVAASALAQPAAPVAPVTVQSSAMPKVIQEQARTFVETHGAPTAQLGQIARWRDPVCVQSIGLRPQAAAMVEKRIADVAQAVGLRAQTKDCAANIEIVFTGKPQVLMDRVARTREQLLGFYHRHDAGKLKSVTHPIQAWYVTATLGGGGNTAGTTFAYFETSGGVGGLPTQLHREVLDDPDNFSPTGCGDSPHFTACLQGVFKNVLVVVDSNRLQGKDLGLLSDYLVMLALSQPRALDGCGMLPSVIDSLSPAACAGRDTPDGLTPGDASYLTALYASDPEAKGFVQAGDIAGRMTRILIKAAGR